jgi:hypothetical protein
MAHVLRIYRFESGRIYGHTEGTTAGTDQLSQGLQNW